uniref:Peptidase A2 domain-containing protein n=1 Tax=Chromera velia CCMP2878 TaxID=1169474 RepID=A0A0G4I3Q4_9ALVE|eukprot:Cvel_35547.t1-p1 / transcript=Cvel_35547.t1 / gene=Cvel_35547 / organism=Chromera_velia_CCMP2878 / gene_product=hypothetical protein / transcript_product=hypothetical protein / location=Cvel_scaffold6541:85-828(+) / protein_length=248 / sequence_SO=supercontig / SO=protein_coding / is_pseudo=false
MAGRAARLIRFHGCLNGVPVRCLFDPGADSSFVAQSVAESNGWELRNLEDPTACKGGLIGGPRLRIDREATGLNLEIQGFNASHDFVVVDLDEDYDVILGMPFCEKYDPRPHWREKILRFPAKTSPSGEKLHLLDSEVYPEEGGDEFFGRRELRRLIKKQSTKLHLFRLEGISRGCEATAHLHSIATGGKQGGPPPLSSVPPNHPINFPSFAGLRKHLQGGEVDPRVCAVLKKHYNRFPDELPGLPPH